MAEDALGAVEGRDIRLLSFYDLSGGSLGCLLGFMECGLSFSMYFVGDGERN